MIVPTPAPTEIPVMTACTARRISECMTNDSDTPTLYVGPIEQTLPTLRIESYLLVKRHGKTYIKGQTETGKIILIPVVMP